MKRFWPFPERVVSASGDSWEPYPESKSQPQPTREQLNGAQLSILAGAIGRIESRLVAIQSWQQSIEKYLLPGDMKPGPIQFVPDATDLKIRGECITTAIHMNKGMAVDLVIIEAEKLFQFLKGQHIAHGNKVH